MGITRRCLAAGTLALAIMGVVSSRVQAGIVLSNLDQPVAGVGHVGYIPQFSNYTQYAQEFTTGSQSFTLSSIVASLGAASGSFTGFAELVTDSANSPGPTVLTTFTFPTIGASYANLSFSANSGGVVLSANTSYWFLLGSSSGAGQFGWQYTGSNTVEGQGSLPNYAYSFNGGASYTTVAGSPFLIQINSVPEPSSAALCGIAGVVGMAMGWRRHRRARMVV